jgi:hypothetical protein
MNHSESLKTHGRRTYQGRDRPRCVVDLAPAAPGDTNLHKDHKESSMETRNVRYTVKIP